MTILYLYCNCPKNVKFLILFYENLRKRTHFRLVGMEEILFQLKGNVLANLGLDGMKRNYFVTDPNNLKEVLLLVL